MTRLSKTKFSVNKLLEDEVIFSQAYANKSYSATTKDIEITVWPEFLDSKSSAVGDLFVWAYHVRIDNKSSDSVQLLNRYWRIIDEMGVVQEVNGEGVVGEQPIIISGGSYQYSSGVHLRHPSGIMAGKYQMQKIEGDEVFDVTIPTFSLDVPTIKNVVN
ncbi:MAG: Co2+/Mg2+ efflux protein ApaG [Proteobacteria bacterium]|nr:Co2+/Mg2+ efflux protein ApaG [Pseudomonadota bacterium]